MSGFIRAFCIFLACGILWPQLPASAQTPDDRPALRAPVGLDRAARRAIVEELEREEIRITRESSRRAAQLGLPTRIRQPDGSLIDLVAFENGRPVYRTSTNIKAARLTRTNQLYEVGGLGLALNGRNMVIGVWDEGHVMPTHQEFADRIRLGDDGTVSTHATHVGGTIAAFGVRPDARGMAREAQVISYNWTNDTAEMGQEALNGMLISNHSYGNVAGWHFGDFEETGTRRWYWFGDVRISNREDYQFGRYGTSSSRWDQAIWANPYFLPVTAAGNDRADSGPVTGTFRSWVIRNGAGGWETFNVNDFLPERDGGADGYDTLEGAGVAKNTLVVGSIGERDGPGGPVLVSDFSSFGPTDDGRIKPDVVGAGEMIISPIANSEQAYGISSGTSMATPNVSGSLLLLQQHYRDVTGEFMRGATLRGLAIHTATDLGNPGPDYRYGWGLLNAERAARQITDVLGNRLSVIEERLPTGSIYAQQATVTSDGPLRITLVWADPPSNPGPHALNDRRPLLINDLDLRLLHDATGTIHFPYVLDVENPSAPATTGDNIVDNVEQIFLPVAQAGQYTISVSHKRQLQTVDFQPFSLFVTGAVDRQRVVAVIDMSSSANVEGVHLTWRSLFEREEGTYCVVRYNVITSSSGNPILTLPVLVGSVPSTGSETVQAEYEMFDRFVLATRYMYRVYFTTLDDECGVPGPGRPMVVEAELEVLVPAPQSFAVITNYPNPFRDETRLILDLPASLNLVLEVYNTLGQRMGVVFDGFLPSGRHYHPIDTQQWPSGLYIVRATTREGSMTHPIIKIGG